MNHSTEAKAVVLPGTQFERDGKYREVVRLIPANRFVSAALEWRRPGRECRSYACSEYAWAKWVKEAREVPRTK